MTRHVASMVGLSWWAVGWVLTATPTAAARPPDPPVRVVAAKATSPAATFAARQPGTDGFKVLPATADLSSGDLLVTLPGAVLESNNRAVGLKSLADYDGRSPLPALETAFTLNEAKEADLDITLDRGRVDLSNTKTEGAATVRVRFWDQSWRITLDAPGARVALELCGRWPPGSRFKPAEKGTEKPPSPAASLVMLVLKGSVAVDLGGLTLGLKTPPGPALMEWDSLTGTRPQPQKLEKLPEWADPEATLSEAGQKAAATVERFRKARAENQTAALKAFLGSADPIEQRVALVTLGATDDLDTLGRELAVAKTPEEWDFGITILRHWLGRCPGHDQKLYEILTSPALGYSARDAKIIMQLLFGFGPDDLSRPETFEVLIEYLTHDQAAVRNLAAWHLVRLVPQGKAIAFKPGWTKEECAPVYLGWKKLIPAGQLPPRAKKE
ncbi:MAG: hypothetical protein JWO38_7817 [Gemmataceae bacterium]|nr:hypothetical protein [Gemmataceae bacterium]